MVSILLESGCSVTATDKDFTTAIEIAASKLSLSPGHVAALVLLKRFYESSGIPLPLEISDKLVL